MRTPKLHTLACCYANRFLPFKFLVLCKSTNNFNFKFQLHLAWVSRILNWFHRHNFSRILQSTKYLLQNYLVCSVVMQITFDRYLSNRPQVSMIYRLIHHAGSNVVPASRVVYHASKPETLVVQLLLYKSSEDARFFYEFHWHNKPQLIDQAERAHRFGYYINTHVQMSKCICARKIANVP